jgi:hypothetical protein
MSVMTAQRCECGEQHAVEIPGPEMEDIVYLRLHDLAPIECCEGCGRSFAEMVEELERWDGLWDEQPGPDPYGVRCGGVRWGGES